MRTLLLFARIFVFILTVQVGKGDSVRRRRSIIELAGMISAVTNRNPKEFLLYGNWCGPGGGGPTVDNIDACCEIHDNCYAKLEELKVCQLRSSFSVYLVSYRWKFQAGFLSCEPTNNACQRAVCECDRFVANCFAQNVPSYNRQQHRLRRILGKN